MSVIGYECDHNAHQKCTERLGAMSMLNGKFAVLTCDCQCHDPREQESDA